MLPPFRVKCLIKVVRYSTLTVNMLSQSVKYPKTTEWMDAPPQDGYRKNLVIVYSVVNATSDIGMSLTFRNFKTPTDILCHIAFVFRRPTMLP